MTCKMDKPQLDCKNGEDKECVLCIGRRPIDEYLSMVKFERSKRKTWDEWTEEENQNDLVIKRFRLDT